MGPISKLKIFYWFHTHEYDKVLKFTGCDLLDPKEKTDKVKYQALSSFYLKNYYHSRKCYELLVKNQKANADDYTKIAYIYARHNEKENAIISWCKALELNKGQKVAKMALDHIKKKGREVSLIEDKYFEDISIKEPLLIPFKLIFRCFLILVFLIFFSFFFVSKGPELYRKFKTRQYRSDISKVLIDDYNPNVLNEYPEEGKEYSYTENEVRKNFELVKGKILAGDVNAAIVLINKLRLSNASLNVKAKLEILEGFMEEPDYYSFENTFSYLDIKEEPKIYDNVYVKWHGKIVNRVINKNKIAFNLLLGNEKEGYIEGVVPVVFQKAVIAENGTFALVFGRIRIKEENKLELEGLYLIRD